MPFSRSFPLWQQKNATFTQKWVDTVFSIIQPSLSSLPPVATRAYLQALASSFLSRTLRQYDIPLSEPRS
jgi:hypothetical protein